LGMNNRRHYCERWFMSNIHEMVDAFVDVSLWCKKENDLFTMERKVRLIS
jgi:hypothetical protein